MVSVTWSEWISLCLLHRVRQRKSVSEIPFFLKLFWYLCHTETDLKGQENIWKGIIDNWAHFSAPPMMPLTSYLIVGLEFLNLAHWRLCLLKLRPNKERFVGDPVLSEMFPSGYDELRLFQWLWEKNKWKLCLDGNDQCLLLVIYFKLLNGKVQGLKIVLVLELCQLSTRGHRWWG